MLKVVFEKFIYFNDNRSHDLIHSKKKNSTERTILPIEHFKPALLPILNFIILSDLITH